MTAAPGRDRLASWLVAQAAVRSGLIGGLMQQIGSAAIAAEVAAMLAEAMLAHGEEASLRRWLGLLPAGCETRRGALLGGSRAELAPADFAAELTRAWPDQAEHWVLLGATHPDAAIRLESCDQALALDPASIAARVERSRALADLGRFDEAEAACGGAAEPLRLQLQRCHVQHVRGSVREAAAALEALCQRHPQHRDAWLTLSFWHAASGDDPAAGLRCARAMQAALPADVRACAQLANELAQRGQLAEAATMLERILAINPKDVECRAALARLHPRSPSPSPASDRRKPMEYNDLPTQLELELRDRDATAALLTLKRLASEPNPSRYPLDKGIAKFEAAGLGEVADEVLRKAAQLPRTWPARKVWIERCLQRGRLKDAYVTARNSLPHASSGGEVAARLCELCAEQGRAVLLLAFVLPHWRGLRRSTAAWGSAGCALSQAGFHWLATRLLADWRGRKEVASRMLAALALSLRERGHDAQAAEVSRAGLKAVSDHTRPQHEVWLAVDAALSGADAEADAALGRLGRYTLEPRMQALLAMTRGILDARAHLREGRAGEALALLPEPVPTGGASLVRLHRAARRMLADARRMRSLPDGL